MKKVSLRKGIYKRCWQGIAAVGALALAVTVFSRPAMLSFGRRIALLSAGSLQAFSLPHRATDERAVYPVIEVPSAMADDAVSVPTVTEEPWWVPTETVAPPEAGDGGKIAEEALTAGSGFVQGVAIRNNSSRTVDVEAALARLPSVGYVSGSTEPQVLIMHTHTTECYMTYDAGYYNADDPSRTRDETKNVVAVGEALAVQLREAGIGVLHDTTVHDDPQYTGAYDRSAATVEALLAQYPSICVVLDIHRDSINRSAGEKLKPTVEIEGHKAAQMMIIASVGDSEEAPNPHWQENLGLAVRLQRALHTRYEGLLRPLYVVDSRYNQHLTNGSLLVEVGAEANTVPEAIYSVRLLGAALAQLLPALGGAERETVDL